MHFSKSYSQLLLTLPLELRSSAIEYRQLKKLINELVTELDDLGLSPQVLHDLLHDSPAPPPRGRPKGKQRAPGERPADSWRPADSQRLLSVSLPPDRRSPSPAKVVYELADEGASGEIVPRLRLWVDDDIAEPRGRIESLPDVESSSGTPSRSRSRSPADEPDVVILSSPVGPHPRQDLLWSLQERAITRGPNSWHAAPSTDAPSTEAPDTEHDHELVIPLASDTAFFRLLVTALASLSTALNASRDDFTASIQALSTAIARTSRPASAKGKSDLYTWRAIFQLYIEAQVFESTAERDRGPRTVAAAEPRLAQFARRVAAGGFALEMSGSRAALERFLELNVRLMNLKKFQQANADAARKILKKHAKRTALPLPPSATELIPALDLATATASVPHLLVVALTETLMPVVPHIDDYLCLICTAIAFKPIRLRCAHLFCVRCLVKMQKQGKDNCPMCRAPTVIIADKSNVDYALLNFMADWFPRESKEKRKANERESAQEEMEELGLDTRCVIA